MNKELVVIWTSQGEFDALNQIPLLHNTICADHISVNGGVCHHFPGIGAEIVPLTVIILKPPRLHEPVFIEMVPLTI